MSEFTSVMFAIGMPSTSEASIANAKLGVKNNGRIVGLDATVVAL